MYTFASAQNTEIRHRVVYMYIMLHINENSLLVGRKMGKNHYIKESKCIQSCRRHILPQCMEILKIVNAGIGNCFQIVNLILQCINNTVLQPQNPEEMT